MASGFRILGSFQGDSGGPRRGSGRIGIVERYVGGPSASDSRAGGPFCGAGPAIEIQRSRLRASTHGAWRRWGRRGGIDVPPDGPRTGPKLSRGARRLRRQRRTGTRTVLPPRRQDCSLKRRGRPRRPRDRRGRTSRPRRRKEEAQLRIHDGEVGILHKDGRTLDLGPRFGPECWAMACCSAGARR